MRHYFILMIFAIILFGCTNDQNIEGIDISVQILGDDNLPALIFDQEEILRFKIVISNNTFSDIIWNLRDDRWSNFSTKSLDGGDYDFLSGDEGDDTVCIGGVLFEKTIPSGESILSSVWSRDQTCFRTYENGSPPLGRHQLSHDGKYIFTDPTTMETFTHDFSTDIEFTIVQ